MFFGKHRFYIRPYKANDKYFGMYLRNNIK